MQVRDDTGRQYALVKGVFDPEILKRQVEQQITAAEERNKRFLESAARSDMAAYVKSTSYVVKPNPTLAPPQLSLNFNNAADSKVTQSAPSI
jgi:enamine deaminase RidA (YjgF/YER057c/UK114 family)